MAYSPIVRANADPTTTSHNDLTLETSPSPRLADIPFTPLSLSFEDLVNDATSEDRGTRPEHADSTVSKFLSSLTSSSRQSYDLVEDDDYEVTDQDTPTVERRSKDIMAAMTETHYSEPAHDDLPIRTASISQQLPLNHPMPDLQSLQGAYIKNVERLEESAERLSMRSSLQEELQRVKHEQRQRERAASGSGRVDSIRSGPQRQVSTQSLGRLFVDFDSAARSGDYSPAAYVGSPVGSLKSPDSNHNASNHRLSKTSKMTYILPEPEFEGRPLDSDLTFIQEKDIPDLDPRPVRTPSPPHASQVDRPITSGSDEMGQEASTFFPDFDGVHFTPTRSQLASRRRISLSRPPRARDSRAFKEAQPGEEMIYYPAPVPVMLNLPMRLSKGNWGEQEKRRLKALSGIPDDMRKSAAWLANEEVVPASNHRHSVLPPQLRASAFFDHRGTTQDVQLKDGSAVATLDSILDAAAHAPVSAFTDHPIAGHLGNDIYGAERSSRKSMQMPTEKKTRRKSSLSTLLKPRRSSGNPAEAMARESRVPSATLSERNGEGNESEPEHVEDDAERSMVPDPDEMPEEGHESKGEADRSEESDTDSESQFRPGFLAAPTTLLAELQMRKAQQRSRNRTAVDAFPNGMHSTLLELDTVAQLQQKARKQKHVKLAWEDKDAVDKENFDDDDIPLGVLFPEKEQQHQVNLNRPMGLMEKKELEENEPLSHRRARLRGEPIQPPAPSRSPGISHHAEEAEKPTLNLPKLGMPDDEDSEGETLAQRRQRMRYLKENGSSSEFARHLSSELGLKVDGVGAALSSPSEPKTPDIEETLGQRRKRLQAEAAKNGSRDISGGSQSAYPVLKTKRSLADVLQAHPIGYVDPNQSKTAQSVMLHQERAREREAKFFAAQEADRRRAQASVTQLGSGHQRGLIQTSINNYQMYQQPYANMAGPYVPSNHGMGTVPTNYPYPSIATFNTQPRHMNPAMGMMNVQTTNPYQHPMAPGYAYPPTLDLTGMGPPLDQKQRAMIEGWRQGIM